MSAQDDFEQLGLAIDGAKNQLVVALAPAIQSIAENLLAILPSADAMRSGFVSALHAIATGVAYTIDAYDALKAAVLFVVGEVVQTSADMANAIAKVIDFAGKAEAALTHSTYTRPAWITDTVQTLQAMGDSLKQQSGEAADAVGTHAEKSMPFCSYQ